MSEPHAAFFPELDEAGRREREAAFDWPAFERDLLFPTLAPLAMRVGSSGFRAILKDLDLPKGAKALDVGAGGFAGATTTRHLVDILDAKIDAVELIPELAEKLEAAFPKGRLNVVVGDIFDFKPPAEPYDILVFDLPIIGDQIETLIPRWLPHLKPGGYVLTDFVYDLAQTFDCREPLLNPTRRTEFEDLLTHRFRATHVDPVTAQRAYFGTPLTVRGIVDKWLCKSPCRGFGWLVLQKEGLHPEHRGASIRTKARRRVERLIGR